MKETKSKKPQIERVRLYALGSTEFANRLKAAAALSGVTQETFVTEAVAAKVDHTLATTPR